MEAQSAALAYGFGLNYEFGKRTIRSMSNDEFNSLTSEQVAEMSAAHTHVILQRFIQAVPRVLPAQTEIFKQYVTIEKLKVEQNIALAKWIIQNGIDLALTGKAGPDIDTTPPDTGRSKTGTTITQDAEGKVTTFVAVDHPDTVVTIFYSDGINSDGSWRPNTKHTRTHQQHQNTLNWWRKNVGNQTLEGQKHMLAQIVIVQKNLNEAFKHFH